MGAPAMAVPVSEWRRVAECAAHFLVRDEDVPLGHVQLSVLDRRRRWVAGNGDAVVVVEGGPVADRDEVPGRPVLLSPRLLTAAVELAGAQRGDVTLELGGDPRTGRLRTTALGAGGSLSLLAGAGEFPAFEELAGERVRNGGASATLERDCLRPMLEQATRAPLGVDTAKTNPLFWLEVGQGELRLSVDWRRHGLTLFRLPAATTGSAAAAVPLCCIGELVEGATPGPLAVTLPAGWGGRVVIAGTGLTGYIMPVDASAEAVRPRVEAALAEAFGLPDPPRDSDGDYVLSSALAPLFGRLIAGDPHRLRLFSVAAELEPTAELLAELNELNSGLPFVRLYSAGTKVVVAVDLDAARADADELAERASGVARFAADLGPVLRGVFGDARERA